MEDKLLQLQEKVAFLELELQNLSDEFASQQKDIEDLKFKLEYLLEKEKNRAHQQQASESSGSIFDDKPPHY